MRTLGYRFYPNKAQRRLLMGCLMESHHIYNETLAATKEQYAQTGKFLFKDDLTMRFVGRGGDRVPATTVQMLADRLDKALRRYLAFKEQGISCGFPRFKTPNRWHSIPLRQHKKDFRLHEDGKHLCVPGKVGLFLKIKRHRPIEAGHQVVNVPARFTSQTCHRCGEIVQKILSVRTHLCPFCGYVEDRDVNAAKNILQAGAPPSETARDAGPDELRSPRL